MIVAMLITVIGLIPIVLAFNIHKLYEKTRLATMLKIYMLLISIWQFYVASLFLVDIVDKEVVEFLFRLFRAGPIFSIPVIYWIIYIVLKDEPMSIKKDGIFHQVLNTLFNRVAFTFVVAWSIFVYITNWTQLGVKSLNTQFLVMSKTFYYFPEYGTGSLFFIIHVSNFIVFLIITIVLSMWIINKDTKLFIMRFGMYSIVLFVLGMMNFLPEIGGVTSSIGVVVFSTAIIFEFIQFHSKIKMDYYKLLERQKKMDYTGNIAGSLVHEVKNTNEIIHGFSKMLQKSKSLEDRDAQAAHMIEESSKHLKLLTDNYKQYIQSSNIKYQLENIVSIARESVEVSTILAHDKNVTLSFKSDVKRIETQANRVNLKQAIINLIKNSIESIPNDRDKKHISINLCVENEHVCIYIEDTGKGIPPENWESIFDPFISLDKRGMGFGLPFVKKILMEHLGNIQIVSSSHSGTNFKLELPQLKNIY